MGVHAAAPLTRTPFAPCLGPLKPKRPSAAVRKSLRTALAGIERLQVLLGDADPRRLRRGSEAAAELVKYAQRMLALTTELDHAVKCERNRDLWRRGKPYAE